MVWRFAVITLVVLASLRGASAGDQPSSIAKLSRADGQVFVTAEGGTEGAARAGQALMPGTRVRTGASGAAELLFNDGTRAQLRANSSMMLSGTKRVESKKSAVVLFFGRLWSKVAKANTGETSYEVNTPNAVAGVRGTEFETAVGDDGTVRVRVDEGKVAVEDDDDEIFVSEDEQVDADADGTDEKEEASDDSTWKKWEGDASARAKKDGSKVMGSVKDKVNARKAKIEALRTQQTDLEAKRKGLESRAKAGDATAAAEVKRINQELKRIANEIADLGDSAASQFGYADHLADLANDPRFGMIGAKNIAAEAKSLRRIKADLDKMVKEGTDISVEAMDQMLRDMGDGKRGTLKDKKGSTTKDLFGDDDMDMR